jgi:hypothetical protein
MTIIGISIVYFFRRVPYLKFQDSSKYGKIQRQIAQCTWRTCWEIGHFHISWIVVGILTIEEEHSSIRVRNSWKNEPRLLQGLGALRRRHQARRDWRGAKGGEKDKFRSADQRFRRRKMSPFNPRERQSLAWLCHLFKKFQWFPFKPSQPR